MKPRGTREKNMKFICFVGADSAFAPRGKVTEARKIADRFTGEDADTKDLRAALVAAGCEIRAGH